MTDKPEFKSEIDWYAVWKKPIKLFGYSYFYFLAALLMLGLLYTWNLNTIGKNAVLPTFLQDSVAIIKDIPLQSPRIMPPIDISKVGVANPDIVNKGHELYKNNCAACHGESGQGNGPSASLLNPKPRNFRSLEGWKNGSKVSQLYKTLQEGVSGSSMASYNYLPPLDRFALAHFIRTFANNQSKDSPDDFKQLDATYELSKGIDIAGQIPIKRAEVIIVKESIPLAREVEFARKKLAESNVEGAIILRRTINDEAKILTLLLQNKKNLSSLNELIKAIAADPLHAGFKPNVTNLSAREWLEMYGFVLTLMKKEG
jgi:mono/diheme cytochrome c family protein